MFFVQCLEKELIFRINKRMNILSICKHLFVPHRENNFKPHLLREVGVSVLLFASVFLLGTSFGSSFFIHKTVLGAEIASSVLIDLTNESRIEFNQSPLLRSQKLDQAAELKGEDMVNKGYFSHNSPTGVTPWHWLQKVGYNFLYAGENLAINFTDSSDVEKAWLESPTHRANIMNVEFREIGMATVKGTYNNYPTIYIVQMFGTPAYGRTSAEIRTEQVVKDVSPIKKREVLGVSTSSVAVIPVQDTDYSHKKGVQGTSTVTAVQLSSSTLESLVATQEMAIVKDISMAKIVARDIIPIPSYSTWYEKILFRFPYYADIIYKVIILFVAITLVSMILIEIRKQHVVHIVYGVSLLMLLTLFVYINKGFF